MPITLLAWCFFDPVADVAWMPAWGAFIEHYEKSPNQTVDSKTKHRTPNLLHLC